MPDEKQTTQTFDPDQFMQSRKPFDPDEYMKNKPEPTVEHYYPAAGPGGPLVTAKMPKSQSEQLEGEERDARTQAGLEAIPTVAAGGMANTVGEAIAARSLRPLYPLVRGYLGMKAGGYIGHDVGSMVGAPEAGERIGQVTGGLAGGVFGAKVPHPKAWLLNQVLQGAPEAAEATGETTVMDMPKQGGRLGGDYTVDKLPKAAVDPDYTIDRLPKGAAPPPSYEPPVSLGTKPAQRLQPYRPEETQPIASMGSAEEPRRLRVSSRPTESPNVGTPTAEPPPVVNKAVPLTAGHNLGDQGVVDVGSRPLGKTAPPSRMVNINGKMWDRSWLGADTDAESPASTGRLKIPISVDNPEAAQPFTIEDKGEGQRYAISRDNPNIRVSVKATDSPEVIAKSLNDQAEMQKQFFSSPARLQQVSPASHAFEPPPARLQQVGPGRLPVNQMTEENPLARSTKENPANVRFAQQPEQLEAAANRQHEYINGGKFHEASGGDVDLRNEAKKFTNNVETEAGRGSIQRAYKALTGKAAYISSAKGINAPGKMGRIEAMNEMLEAGYTPKQIVEAARTPSEQ